MHLESIAKKKIHLKQILEAIVNEVQLLGRKEGTQKACPSQLAYCRSFCKEADIDISSFGLFLSDPKAQNESLEHYLSILVAFSCYAVFYPR